VRLHSGSTVAVLSGVSLLSALAFAADADPVVARAGNRPLTASAVSSRIALTPPAQLAALAGGGESAPRALLDRVLVPELLASLEAERRGLDKSPRVADRIREILRQALERSLRSEAAAKAPVTGEQVRAYYEANRAKYDQPARIRIWRILVADEASARALLEKVNAESRPAKWSDLARESSLDKATNQRQGDLGFVRPDGSTDVPRVQVNPAIYKAAETVKDGELVPKPVPEGDKFAVVWRRGSLAASKRTLEAESTAIRQLLERQRLDAELEALRSSLRAERVKEEKPELLEVLPAQLFGEKLPRPRPIPSARMPPPGLSRPEKTDDGLR
jgi:peptidyl-prolyl cis-trans isomerase C